MTKRKANHTPQEIIEAWESSQSIQEAAKKLNCSESSLSQRARQYRKAGVKLKRMPSRQPLPVAELNALIEELNKEQK